MQDGVGGAPDSLGSHLTGRWPEQGQELGGAVSDVLMRLPSRIPLRCPALARIGHGAIRSCLVLIPQGDARRFRHPIGQLDQPLFCSVSGSTTVTTPLFRTRCAVPVGHQLLVFWYELPASSRTRLMVFVPICSNPSFCNRFCRVDRDQVAVPSCLRSGAVWAVATICARALASYVGVRPRPDA